MPLFSWRRKSFRRSKSDRTSLWMLTCHVYLDFCNLSKVAEEMASSRDDIPYMI